VWRSCLPVALCSPFRPDQCAQWMLASSCCGTVRRTPTDSSTDEHQTCRVPTSSICSVDHNSTYGWRRAHPGGAHFSSDLPPHVNNSALTALIVCMTNVWHPDTGAARFIARFPMPCHAAIRPRGTPLAVTTCTVQVCTVYPLKRSCLHVGPPAYMPKSTVR
jgi:hypothetical protein